MRHLFGLGPKEMLAGEFFPPDDTASNLNSGARNAAGFPQFGRGSIRLPMLFKNPADRERYRVRALSARRPRIRANHRQHDALPSRGCGGGASQSCALDVWNAAFAASNNDCLVSGSVGPLFTRAPGCGAKTRRACSAPMALPASSRRTTASARRADGCVPSPTRAMPRARNDAAAARSADDAAASRPASSAR